MLPKKNRLDKKLFDETFKDSKTYHANSLYLKVSKSEEAGDSKFAFVVPVKVSKKAVGRNKLRRQGYNAVNKHIDKIEKGFVAIFFLKKEILETNFDDYEKEVVSLLKKSRLLK